MWCTSTPSQCGQNVYDYNGIVQEASGKACWLPDKQCQVGIDGNSTSTSLCELTVNYIIYTLFFHKHNTPIMSDIELQYVIHPA